MYIVGSMMKERDGCLEGTPNWRIARFGWGVFVEGQDFCFGGDAELARERDSAGCVCEFVGRMIYIQAGQSLTSRACSTVGGAN